MIPIRRYPYTDFHDLNLDYLLRQIAEFEEDLEALKRRVTALEGWKVIIDGDITTIKGDIITIKNDILDIKGDIVTIQGDIVTINRNIDDHSVRIGDLEKNTYAFMLRAYPSTFILADNPDDPDYPYQATLDLTIAGSVPQDYEKFIDGDFVVNSKSHIDLEFRTPADYFNYGKILSSYVVTGQNYVTLFAKEVPAETLYFYAYIINESLNT